MTAFATLLEVLESSTASRDRTQSTYRGRERTQATCSPCLHTVDPGMGRISRHGAQHWYAIGARLAFCTLRAVVHLLHCPPCRVLVVFVRRLMSRNIHYTVPVDHCKNVFTSGHIFAGNKLDTSRDGHTSHADAILVTEPRSPSSCISGHGSEVTRTGAPALSGYWSRS